MTRTRWQGKRKGRLCNEEPVCESPKVSITVFFSFSGRSSNSRAIILDQIIFKLLKKLQDPKPAGAHLHLSKYEFESFLVLFPMMSMIHAIYRDLIRFSLFFFFYFCLLPPTPSHTYPSATCIYNIVKFGRVTP